MTAEPNHLPLIEFDQPDLPWRYTPSQATELDRLRPWMCLIALRDDEILRRENPQRARRLPIITVGTEDLPFIDQIWAWAHVQASGVDQIDAASTAQLLENEPHRLISRILCPRRLDPNTAYTAFLVPTFERGRRMGTGEDLTDSIDALAPAWSRDPGEVRLPVYYGWRFQTGDEEDFASLIRQLRARRLPDTVGKRDMDVNAPGLGLPPAASTPLAVEGALRAPTEQGTPWSDGDRTQWTTALVGVVNRPADVLAGPAREPILAPPLYGRWYPGRDRLAAPPPWFDELNIDPRLRVAAGAGTTVVQNQQQQLMAAAWQQVDAIRRMNDQFRQAQLAREVASSIYKRGLVAAQSDLLLTITAPVHSRVLGNPATVRAQFLASPILPGIFESQWRRTVRALGPIGRRQGRNTIGQRRDLLARLNDRSLLIAPPARAPEALPTLARVGAVLVPPSIDRREIERRHATSVLAWRDGTFGATEIQSVPPRPSFVAAEAQLGSQVPVRPSAPPSRGGSGDSPSARAFRKAAAALYDRLGVRPEASPPRPSVDLTNSRNRVLAATNPERTVAGALRSRLNVAGSVMWQPNDPIEPPMAAPEFKQPMYEPLKDLSYDWILPGLANVPANTATLLLSNQRFIEAYMIGVNHEMARELLWNEYPTDQRGTVCRQFWDTRGYFQPSGEFDPDVLKDIKPIHTWLRTAALGENTSRRLPPGREHLVLLIRSELFLRYPNTIVCAQQATRNAAGRRVPGGDQLQPVFLGSLPPDVVFFGFELTVEQVRGDPGWFFVLEQQPSEPQFGLNVQQAPQLLHWDDLSWSDLGDPATVRYIDLNLDRPDTRGIRDPQPSGLAWHVRDRARASDIAYITFRQPIQIAVHGSLMVPPGSPPPGSPLPPSPIP
jgi:hypothetical protein